MTNVKIPSKAEVKFTQLVVAPWDGDNGRRTYSMFALGDDGKVYRHDRSKGAWRSAGNRMMSPAAIEKANKEKYGSNYRYPDSSIDD